MKNLERVRQMIVDIHHLLTRATNENIRWIQEIERALKDRHIGTRRAVQKMKLLRIDSFLHARDTNSCELKEVEFRW